MTETQRTGSAPNARRSSRCPSGSSITYSRTQQNCPSSAFTVGVPSHHTSISNFTSDASISSTSTSRHSRRTSRKKRRRNDSRWKEETRRQRQKLFDLLWPTNMANITRQTRHRLWSWVQMAPSWTIAIRFVYKIDLRKHSQKTSREEGVLGVELIVTGTESFDS